MVFKTCKDFALEEGHVFRNRNRLCYITNFVVLGAIVKSRKASISFIMLICLSARPHRTTQLSLYGF